jgi:hypothetical protein
MQSSLEQKMQEVELIPNRLFGTMSLENIAMIEKLEDSAYMIFCNNSIKI